MQHFCNGLMVICKLGHALLILPRKELRGAQNLAVQRHHFSFKCDQFGAGNSFPCLGNMAPH